MQNIIWKLEGAGLYGAGKDRRLHPTSIEIRNGITAIVGHSGSGKTSLLNLLTGFEKPDFGTVRRNIDMNGFKTELFWSPHNGGLWPHLTVEQHLAVVAGKHGVEFSNTLLEEFELSDRRDKRPGELSRGECSRLSIARAITADPAVLVFDEPLVNIDSSRRRKNWKMIVGHAREKSKSLVYSTHSPSHIIGSADAVICISGGKIIYDGSVEKLYLDPPSEEVASYLGEVNWFVPEECQVWLGRSSEKPLSFRPEHLKISGSEEGLLKIRKYGFDGEMAVAELVESSTGRSRTFFSRTDGCHFREGDRVEIKFKNGKSNGDPAN